MDAGEIGRAGAAVIARTIAERRARRSTSAR